MFFFKKISLWVLDDFLDFTQRAGVPGRDAIVDAFRVRGFGEHHTPFQSRAQDRATVFVHLFAAGNVFEKGLYFSSRNLFRIKLQTPKTNSGEKKKNFGFSKFCFFADGCVGRRRPKPARH
jgi:hypothetical protein